MTMTVRTVAIAAVVSLALAVGVQATTIGVYSTGYQAGGATQQVNEGKDGNYTLVSSPAGTTLTGPYVTDRNSFPISTNNWTADQSNAQWISPQKTYSGNLSDPAGTYDYQTSFTLSGYSTSTEIAQIAGQWGADNYLDGIYINGHLIAGTINAGQSTSNFASLTSFVISTGFINGINTLDFVEVNAAGGSGNPTGLFVQLSGTVVPVPEPSSVAGILIGCMGVTALIVRRKRIA